MRLARQCEDTFGRVTYGCSAGEETHDIKLNDAKSEKQLACTRWVNTTRKIRCYKPLFIKLMPVTFNTNISGQRLWLHS